MTTLVGKRDSTWVEGVQATRLTDWLSAGRLGIPCSTLTTITGTDIVRIEDGKFAEYWLNADSLLFMQQIGIHEVPALA